MKKILQLLLMVMPFLPFAQLAVTVTTTPEFCAGDGDVAINVTGTKVGASFDFEIYKLPNITTPVRVASDVIAAAVSFSHAENNFSAGNYTLITYEDVGGVITQKNNSFTITNNFTALAYTVSQSFVCDGSSLTANVTAGAPISYELRTTGGAVVIAAQASNVLSPVAAGSYNMIVTDSCGNTKSLGVTVGSDAAAYAVTSTNSTFFGFSVLQDCNTIDHRERIRYNNTNVIAAYRFPINVTYTIDNPITGIPTVINQTWTSNAQNSVTMGGVPFYAGYTYNYKVDIVDACGKTATQTSSIAAVPNVRVRQFNANCGTKYITVDQFNYFYQPTTIAFTSYPAGFDPANYNSNFTAGSYSHTFTDVPNIVSSVDFGSASTAGVPAGSYTITSTSCGRTVTSTITITNATAYQVKTKAVYPGCGDSDGSVQLFLATTSTPNAQADTFSSVTITSAPAGFVSAYGLLPYNASANIASDGQFYMNSLPIGSYTVQAVGSCGISISGSFTIVKKNLTSTVTPSPGCGNFAVSATINSSTAGENLWLQKYYPSSGKWGHPTTGTLYTDGTSMSNTYGMAVGTTQALDATYATYTGTLSNVLSTGQFRVVLQYSVFDNGTVNLTTCRDVLDSFTISPATITLDDYYTVSCTGGLYNLIIEASGVAPLTYELISKDGIAMSVNNGTDPLFTGLSAGVYRVRISDACGNSSVFSIRLTAPKLPVIKSTNLCDGLNGKLNINLRTSSTLSITWTKDASATVLATGNTLNFSPYNAATADGTYYAHIVSSNPSSCINATISKVVAGSIASNPEAGAGQTVTINANAVTAPIDLFTYLAGYSDANGDWTELTNPSSGLLSGNYWDYNTAISGTYIFQYKVYGNCTGSDTAQVTINFTDTCTKPGDFSLAGNPTKVGITLQTKQDAWPENIPNGFITLQSKTKGLVITRVQNVSKITDAKEGMLVYDIEAACVKLYNGTVWKCIAKSCND